MDIQNIDIFQNSSELLNLQKINLNDLVDFSPFLEKLKVIGWVFVIILVVYVIYNLIKFFREAIKQKRIKLTYVNTKEILEKLDKIEDKINKISSSKKLSEENKEIKKKDKKQLKKL
ncbi:MAG: hypothetical protein ABIG37_03365 [Nanoarchaeota archaeon]|nr:hypothetical protein [Nanoarchaeota archaeon]